MSTLRTTNLQHASSSSNNIVLDSSGHASITNDLKFNSGYGSAATAYGVRAWVNFNGTGTVAIRDSGNVTSISDHGVGDYSLNFTNSMPDTNYCVLGTGSGNANHNSQALSINYTTAPTTSAVRIFTAVTGSANTVGFRLDSAYNCVAVVR